MGGAWGTRGCAATPAKSSPSSAPTIWWRATAVMNSPCCSRTRRKTGRCMRWRRRARPPPTALSSRMEKTFRCRASEARQRNVFSILLDKAVGGGLARLLQRMHRPVFLRVREQHGEFITAVARHQIVGAELGEDLAGVAAQHRVTHSPPIPPVDGLEIVHVNDRDGEREAVALHATDFGLKLLDEHLALGQAGQFIVHAMLARVAEFLTQALAVRFHGLKVIAGARKLIDQHLALLNQLIESLNQNLLEVVEIAQRTFEILQLFSFILQQFAKLLVHRNTLRHLFRERVLQRLDLFLPRRWR